MSTLPLTINGNRARGWALWVVPAVALAALVGWETDWGRQLVRMPSAPPPVESKPVTAAALPEYRIEGGLPAHAEMVARTLFNATRRPAPVLAGDGGPRRLNPGRFLLVGTTVTAERNVAFLKEVAGGKSRVVRQGDEIERRRRRERLQSRRQPPRPARPAVPKPEHRLPRRRTLPKYGRRTPGKPAAPRVPRKKPPRCRGRAAIRPRRAHVSGTGNGASVQQLQVPKPSPACGGNDNNKGQ
ncbi:MAG: hypothetical protein E6H64_17970 [Betaproteobacteria bacterium]|nr:MAG: hypothetical protein E6H64_17970 [Betaproteobacteria bacterium]